MDYYKRQILVLAITRLENRLRWNYRIKVVYQPSQIDYLTI